MLILTRKSNESVIIGNNIEIKILDVRGDQVSIGFSAPREISIYRKEVHEAIQAQNKEAASRQGYGIEELSKSLDTQMKHYAAK